MPDMPGHASRVTVPDDLQDTRLRHPGFDLRGMQPSQPRGILSALHLVYRRRCHGTNRRNRHRQFRAPKMTREQVRRMVARKW
jgi:hypothetical protein